MEGSAVGSAECLVHVDCMESELCCGWLQLNGACWCVVIHICIRLAGSNVHVESSVTWQNCKVFC